jgi:hypothetical protein
MLAIRHVSVIDHAAGDDLLSPFIGVSEIDALHQQLHRRCSHVAGALRPAVGHAWSDRQRSERQPDLLCIQSRGRIEAARTMITTALSAAFGRT